MIRILWHVWRKGHSVRVNRHITTSMSDYSRGWLYRCECDLVVAI